MEVHTFVEDSSEHKQLAQGSLAHAERDSEEWYTLYFEDGTEDIWITLHRSEVAKLLEVYNSVPVMARVEEQQNLERNI